MLDHWTTRPHAALSGATKCLIQLFFKYAVVHPKACKHTLMCKTGGVTVQQKDLIQAILVECHFKCLCFNVSRC